MADFGSINYSQAVANPMDAYTKGLTLGIAQRGMNLQESLAQQKLAEAQAAAQEKAAADQEKQQAIAAFISKPEKTADDYEAFALKWATPKAQEEAIAAARARMSAQDVENKVNYGGEILAYLRNEKPEMAIKRLDELSAAADNAKNPKASTEYRRMKEMVQDNPQAVADMLAFGLVQYPGGKDKLQSVLDMEKAKREAAAIPEYKSSDIEEYNFAKSPTGGGYTKSFEEWQKESRSAKIKAGGGASQKTGTFYFTGDDGKVRQGVGVFNPETGAFTIASADIPGTLVSTEGETPEEKAERAARTRGAGKLAELKAEQKMAPGIAQDVEQAKALGKGAAEGAAKAVETVSKVKTNIANLDKVVKLIDDGASTGAIMSRLPSFRASSIALDNMQKQLGLDVVGSVTFGALSEGELKLALDTALPTKLPPKELRQWVIDKKSAQQKLADYMEEQATFLSSPGATQAGWIATQKEIAAARNRPVTPAAPSGGFKFLGRE